MKSQTSLVATQVRMQQWAEQNGALSWPRSSDDALEITED